VDVCPSRAMSFNSRDWPLEALVREALKDRDYYQAFAGGVTVSGGEPLGQYHAVAELFRRLHQAGVHTALDTCGLAPAAALAAVLPHTDLVLFDLKLLDPGLHQAHTGQPNETILANLAGVAEHVRKPTNGMKLWIRTPLIPAVTATPENLRAIGQFIREELLDVVERWELCAFNSACKSKYERMGLPWSYAEKPLLRQSQVEALRKAALAAGIDADIVVVSGLLAT
jgi:pyruvate formate lyase activating enzyme